jgi:hypothetical protein
VHATGGGTHEVGLQRQAVAIAAGELEDGLNARARKQRRRNRRGEVRPGAGPVGDVDRVGEPYQGTRLAQQIVGDARHRRGDFGGDGELSGAQQRLETRSGLPWGHRLVRRC